MLVACAKRNSGLIVRLTTVVLLLAGFVAGALPAAAQEEGGLIGDTEYESPQFDFALEWDAPWEVVEDSAQSDAEEGLDRVELQSDGAFVQILLLAPTADAEPEDYLDVLVESASEDVEDFEEVARDSGSGFISATVTYTFVGSDDTETPVRKYFEVGEIDARSGNDPALFTGSILSPEPLFEDEWESVQEDIARDGQDQLFKGTPDGIRSSDEGADADDPADDPEDEPADEPADDPEDEPTDDPADDPEDEPAGDSGEENIVDNTFTGPETGFSVSWDEEAWLPIDVTTDTDGDALVLTSTAGAGGFIFRTAEADNASRCVTAAIDELKAADDIADVARAGDDLRPPEEGERATGRLYTYVNSAGGDAVDSVIYIECRPLPEGGFVVIRFLTAAADYEDALEVYAPVIDTLTVEGGSADADDPSTDADADEGDEPATDPEGDAGDEPDADDGEISGPLGRREPDTGDPEVPVDTEDTEDSQDAGNSDAGLSGDAFTGDAFEFSASWDDAVWEAEAIEPDTDYEGVQLRSDGSTAFVEAFAGYDGDAQACVDGTADQLGEIENVSRVRAAQDLDLPEIDGAAEAGLYTYTYTGDDDGTLDFVELIVCWEVGAGESVLRVTLFTPEEAYADQVDAWSELLANIEV